jgi:hypothetical protein
LQAVFAALLRRDFVQALFSERCNSADTMDAIGEAGSAPGP